MFFKVVFLAHFAMLCAAVNYCLVQIQSFLFWCVVPWAVE